MSQSDSSKDSADNSNAGDSRRTFLKKAAGATVSLAGGTFLTPGSEAFFSGDQHAAEVPWFRRITRWGQTNITEKDPLNYDIDWWRNHWKKTHTQGVIINAGGIIAYYPTKVPLHYKAQYLEGRDLFGDLCNAA